MLKHTIFLEAVKDVLQDQAKMMSVCLHNQEKIQDICQERQLKWQLQALIAEKSHEKSIDIPVDLREFLQDVVGDDGKVQIQELEKKESQLDDREEELTSIIKTRVVKMLSLIDITNLTPDALPMLERYEAALSVNKRGYSIHYKRDVDEIMVNTYNPEWIQAWNGNMDFQLCLDYFAVITYISDYYCKDDSGAMKMLQEALKEFMHEDLKTQLKKWCRFFSPTDKWARAKPIIGSCQVCT